MADWNGPNFLTRPARSCLRGNGSKGGGLTNVLGSGGGGGIQFDRTMVSRQSSRIVQDDPSKMLVQVSGRVGLRDLVSST
jgi:hypothetical protein